MNSATLVSEPALAPRLRDDLSSAIGDVEPAVADLMTWAIIEQGDGFWRAWSREYDMLATGPTAGYALEQMLGWLRAAADRDDLDARANSSVGRRTRTALVLTATLPKLAERLGLVALEILVQVPSESFFEAREAAAYTAEQRQDDRALAEAMFPLVADLIDDEC